MLYLQHRANAALDRQTAVIVQKIAEQTATSVHAQIRQTLDAPVFDTLSAVNHPSLREGGSTWSRHSSRVACPPMRRSSGSSSWNTPPRPSRPARSSSTAGRARPKECRNWVRCCVGSIVTRRSAAPCTRTPAATPPHSGFYGAVTEQLAGTSYDIFARVFYVDAARARFFALLGFVVNLDHVGPTLLSTLFERRLRPLLEPRDGSPSFDLSVLDESQRLVFGPTAPTDAMSVRAPFPLTFYPEDIRPRMAAAVPPRAWTLVVSPRPAPSGMLAVWPVRDFGLSALSILLMLAALGLVVRSRRRVAELAQMEADFVAHVSHQIKTSLSLVSAVSETLALDRVRSRDKLARCLDIVRTETAKLEGLVERILDFSRARNHRRLYEFEAVSLSALVRETRRCVRRRRRSEWI